MTIYATQYTKSSGEITHKSVDSYFTSIQDVIKTLGDDYVV